MVTLPAAMPDTTPVLLTVAMPVLLLVQVPLGVEEDRVVVLPIQTVVLPVIGLTTGTALTVRVAVAIAAVQGPVPSGSLVVTVMVIGLPKSPEAGV